jgi:hypothetical protein
VASHIDVPAITTVMAAASVRFIFSPRMVKAQG